jgi:predicted extracellular nuclease
MKATAGRCATFVVGLGLAGLGVAPATVAAADHAAATAPHLAAPQTTSTPGRAVHVEVARPYSAHAATNTAEGAGYSTAPGATQVGISGASVTFTVPSFSCASTSDDESLLPGIWVFNTGGALDLSEQINVSLSCTDGVETAQGIVRTGGANGIMDVNPGDTIVASLSESWKSTTGTLTDLTNHTSEQGIGAATTTDVYVFIGIAGPTYAGASAVPTFTKIVFSKAQVDGEYLTAWNPTQDDLKTGTKVQIATGALNAPGDNFGATFKHND